VGQGEAVGGQQGDECCWAADHHATGRHVLLSSAVGAHAPYATACSCAAPHTPALTGGDAQDVSKVDVQEAALVVQHQVAVVPVLGPLRQQAVRCEAHERASDGSQTHPRHTLLTCVLWQQQNPNCIAAGLTPPLRTDQPEPPTSQSRAALSPSHTPGCRRPPSRRRWTRGSSGAPPQSRGPPGMPNSCWKISNSPPSNISPWGEGGCNTHV